MTAEVVVVVVLLFYVHGKHLRSCWDGDSRGRKLYPIGQILTRDVGNRSCQA